MIEPTFSKHAKYRCRQRRIDEAKVIGIINERLGDNPGNWPKVTMTIYSDGIKVIYSHETETVITVVWSHETIEQHRLGSTRLKQIEQRRKLGKRPKANRSNKQKRTEGR